MSKRSEKKSIARWYCIFVVLMWCSIGFPVLLFATQVWFTWDQLSFNPSELYNWTNFQNTFALPLNSFALLAAVTSLVGLYCRSLLLSQQLKNVEQQITISREQSKRADAQFELAQRKENLVMFFEHRKQIMEEIDKLAQLYGKTKFFIDTGKTYQKLFPSNSATSKLELEASQEVLEGIKCLSQYIHKLVLDDCLHKGFELEDVLIENSAARKDFETKFRYLTTLGFERPLNMPKSDKEFTNNAIEILFHALLFDFVLYCFSKIYISSELEMKACRGLLEVISKDCSDYLSGEKILAAP